MPNALAKSPKRRALLGRLATLGWFARHGEVAATQAVAFLLEETQLRAAVLRHLIQVTKAELGAVTVFHSELVHADRGRPDLEGQDGDGRPLIVVEAKFGARLSDSQVLAYLADQEARLSGVGGALVLLVPSYRRLEAEALLGAVNARTDSPRSQVSTAVITWDDWLDVWDEAVEELPARDRSAARCDLDQLRALCRAMVALDVPPLGPLPAGRDLRERESDLRRLVEEVTKQFFDSTERLIPVGNEPGFDYYRRYIPGGLPDKDCWCSVGVWLSDGRARGGTPFWLRYHHDTSSFQTVSDRIMTSRFAGDTWGDGGHRWLPLRVSGESAGAAISDELTQRIEEIRDVAAGAAPPGAHPS